MTVGCSKEPCNSCPYLLSTPLGVWHITEYIKLLDYDGETFEQRSFGLFLCHQTGQDLCKGWVATHGLDELVAIRLHGDEISDIGLRNASLPTKGEVYKSGAEVYKANYQSALNNPDDVALSAQEKIHKKKKRKRKLN